MAGVETMTDNQITHANGYEHPFYKDYFNYIGDTESPLIYHRWSAVSIIGALLGRQFYLPFGHDIIYPNNYILLVGDPGARKSTAMNIGKALLRASGYTKFAPDRVSPERFIAEMSILQLNEIDESLDMIQLEKINIDEPSEIYTCIGEFSDFIGSSNFDFIKLLTNLWDNLPEYSHPKLHGKSIHVTKPTVNLYGGITPQSIATDIPVEALGQGFMSRFILVYGESTGVKISWPKAIDKSVTRNLAYRMMKIKDIVQGQCSFEEGLMEKDGVLDRMYKEFIDIDDFRFIYYSTRRFTHLLKLSMIFAAMRCSTVISKEDALKANTLLHYTEQKMPKALGEFGKAKNADVANNVMSLIRNSRHPITHKELWKKVGQDLNKTTELTDILSNFKNAGKIRIVDTANLKQGFVAHHEMEKKWADELLDEGFLTLEEKM